MRSIALFVLSAILSMPLIAHGQTHVEGRIETDTTWTLAGSPYVLTGDVEVVGGATLTIEPGVSVEGMAGTRLIVGGDTDGDVGTLQAVGAEFSRVNFKALDSTQPWGGVLFTQNARDAEFSPAGEFLDGSVIKWAYVSQAAAPITMDDVSVYLESLGVVGPQDPDGSGIYVELSPPAKRRLRLRDVEVAHSAGFGLFVYGGGGHILEDCSFESNGMGAAITTLIRTAPEFPRDRIERCTFVRNGVGGGPHVSGGGMTYMGSHVEFIDCLFYSNAAEMNGGGLWGLAVVDATLSNCQFIGNRAGRSGGGMDFDAKLIIEDCVFADNRAERSAGGYLGFAEGPLLVRRSEFRDNWAGRGGAMTLAFGIADIKDCDFEGNQSTTDGGAVRFFRGESQITFTSNRFVNNITAGAGGAVGFIDSDLHESVTFTGNTFEGNIARLGGAVYTTNIDDDVSTFSFAERDGLINTFRNNTAQLGDNIYHASPVDIDATGVCWGVALPAAIANRIHDGRDEPGLGIVSFDPVATTCDTCRTDLDGDGALTLFDYLAFTGLFGLGDPQADFDGDGSLTIFDFLVYQTEFDAGCG